MHAGYNTQLSSCDWGQITFNRAAIICTTNLLPSSSTAMKGVQRKPSQKSGFQYWISLHSTPREERRFVFLPEMPHTATSHHDCSFKALPFITTLQREKWFLAISSPLLDALFSDGHSPLPLCLFLSTGTGELNVLGKAQNPPPVQFQSSTN